MSNYPDGLDAAFWDAWEGTAEQQAERDAEEREAHARLIAAAPELAEAVKSLLSLSFYPHQEGAIMIRHAAREALQKAGVKL